jgi:2,4-diaminopentanoate dehydrogenase
MIRRVIQFSTGNVGHHALRALIERPDLELVGVHASSPAKVGRDAADLCGLDGPTGIVATDDLDALLALEADCVVYTAQAETRPHDALRELTAFLRAGTNVVASSLVWLISPTDADAWLVEPLTEACTTGGTSMYVSGIDPGYSGDVAAFAALGLSTRADTVRVQEIFDYGTYDDAEFTGVAMGFGASPDETPLMFLPGVLTSMWGGPVRQIARELGIELDRIDEHHEFWLAAEPIDCTMARVETGHIGGVRFTIEGIVAGAPRIVMEHVTRLTQAAAPDWPYPPEGRPGVHRVVVTGDPGVELETYVGLGGDVNEAGVTATAARVVNAIHAVCDAEPGLLSVTHLPLAHVAGVMHP